MTEKQTRITFEQHSSTYIKIMRDGKQIGQVYSEFDDGTLPYPHNPNSEKCKNSIQLCGFDGVSQTWACGQFTGKKDLVVNFIDYNGAYMQEQEKEYRIYVEQFMQHKFPMDKLKPFKEWVEHMGHPTLDNLQRELKR